MVRITNHGGQCCGAKHLHGFDEGVTYYDLKRLISETGTRNLHEIILTSEQIREEDFSDVFDAMQSLGFVLTESWVNGNSGNTLYRWSRCSERNPINRDAVPFWNGMIINANMCGNLSVTPPEGPPEHPPLHEGIIYQEPAEDIEIIRPTLPVRTLVFSSYHCVFRNGSRGAGHDTVVDARENLGRRTRIDRRDIYSDGLIHWINDIGE